MGRSRWSASGRVAMAMAGATVLALVWLWGMRVRAGCGPDVLCAATAGAMPMPGEVMPAAGSQSPLLWSDHGGIGATWSSTVPVTTEVTSGVAQEWVIAQYGVTITFQSNSIDPYDGVTAVITFTPKGKESLGPPISPTPYFFELEGIYKGSGKPVSLWNDIAVTLKYREAELGDIKEGTLNAFHLAWGEWTSQGAVVDTRADSLSWSTRYLGVFGVGGFANVVFLPVVCNGMSTE